MQGDRGRIYFWSKLRHADLNSKEWVLGKRSLSLADPRVNTGSVFITCNYIGPEIENPIPLEGICIESCNVVISWYGRSQSIARIMSRNESCYETRKRRWECKDWKYYCCGSNRFFPRNGRLRRFLGKTFLSRKGPSFPSRATDHPSLNPLEEAGRRGSYRSHQKVHTCTCVSVTRVPLSPVVRVVDNVRPAVLCH